jgi:hypothetical protein
MLGVARPLDVVETDPLRGLLAQLRHPEATPKLALAAAILLLSRRGKRVTSSLASQFHTSLRAGEFNAAFPAETGDGAQVLTELWLSDFGRLVFSAAVSDLGRLLDDPTCVQVTLILNDSKEARSNARFEASWRQWLRAWNLLQQLPDARLVTSVSGAESVAPPAPAKVSEAPQPPAPLSLEARLAEVSEVSDEAARVALVDLLNRLPALQAPSVPLELRAPTAELDVDLEFGWRALKVAGYFENERAAAEALTAKGWVLFQIERGLVVDELEAAIRAAWQREGS